MSLLTITSGASTNPPQQLAPPATLKLRQSNTSSSPARPTASIVPNSFASLDGQLAPYPGCSHVRRPFSLYSVTFMRQVSFTILSEFLTPSTSVLTHSQRSNLYSTLSSTDVAPQINTSLQATTAPLLLLYLFFPFLVLAIGGVLMASGGPLAGSLTAARGKDPGVHSPLRRASGLDPGPLRSGAKDSRRKWLSLILTLFRATPSSPLFTKSTIIHTLLLTPIPFPASPAQAMHGHHVLFVPLTSSTH
ncbi:hypothetical protein BKA93DRAFT_862144 [Sparassis latifolia]